MSETTDRVFRPSHFLGERDRTFLGIPLLEHLNLLGRPASPLHGIVSGVVGCVVLPEKPESLSFTSEKLSGPAPEIIQMKRQSCRDFPLSKIQVWA